MSGASDSPRQDWQKLDDESIGRRYQSLFERHVAKNARYVIPPEEEKSPAGFVEFGSAVRLYGEGRATGPPED
jgi:hypothetical protein